MKSISFTFMIVVLFNYIINVFAENEYYIVSIGTRINHKKYDDESKSVQNKIDIMVNDKLNDIYDIIEENKDTYTLKNGQMDEKLDELDSLALNKRHNKNTKFLFINPVEPQDIITFQNSSYIQKRSDNSTNILNDKVEYIPVESKLIIPLCPIGNDYAIVVYASDKVVKKVKKLPDIKKCSKSLPTKNHVNTKNKYYDLDFIRKETNWTDVSIQNNISLNYNDNLYSHLSLTSQSHFDYESTEEYDNTYYYPSTAGQGIDIYLLEEMVDFNYEEFDTYDGSRSVTCDAIADYDYGFYELSKNDKRRTKGCRVNRRESDIHGTIVSMMAGGKYTGSAKKANIHVIATSLHTYSEIQALRYIKLNAKPHKTIINLSRGGIGENDEIQQLFTDLTRDGFIIFVSAGNEKENCTSKKYRYGGFDDVITVGATEKTLNDDIINGYTVASYTNYGYCVDIFAPGEAFFPALNGNYIIEKDGKKYNHDFGTSFSSPLAAGIAATIMSEQFEIKYTYKLMKETLIKMSLKNVLFNLPDYTENRFINNGKRVVYSPKNVYYGCGENSGYSKCSKGCCTKDNKCVEFNGNDVSQSCYIDNGCQSNYGEFCLLNKSTSTSPKKNNNRCGPGYGSCIIKNGRYVDQIGCCSKDGYCGTSSEHCGKGCQSEFGVCYSSN